MIWRMTKPFSREFGNKVLVWTLRSVSIVGATTTVAVFVFVLGSAVGFFRNVGLVRMLADGAWHPSDGQYGTAAVVLGSLFLTGGTIAVSAPIGVASAIFSQYYAPRTLRIIYDSLLKVLAGVPSVVFGLWGLLHVVPIIARVKPPGQSMLAGIVVLSIMVIPTLSLFVTESLATVPPDYVHGGAALAFSRWAIIRRVVLPSARSGILAGIVLAMGRAIGETMAVLMVCGNVVQMPLSLFRPMRPMTAHIALEMAYATGTHRSALFACGVVLIAMVGILTFTAQRFARGTGV